MREQKILIPPKFLEKAEALPKEVKSKLIHILKLLSRDFRHPSLQCKKIKGNRGDIFECRVDRDIRLIYDCTPDGIRCWYVGDHDVALRFAENVSPSGISVDDIELQRTEDELLILEHFMLLGKEPTFIQLDFRLLSLPKPKRR
jgi:mRNA-degrading endonuclease YafQ of YafQ-DinJ toxin-antitoxin module